MKVWCVFGGIQHNGCIDNWSNMDETGLEKIFSSEEKAEDYIRSIEIPVDDVDDEDSVIHLTWDNDCELYTAPNGWGDDIVYYIREMEVE